MKKLFFLFVCGLLLSSCDSDNADTKEENTSSNLLVIGSKLATVPNETDLVFTDDDIVLYNISNGEIIFAETKLGEIIYRVSNHSVLHFFINDNPVFVPPIRIHFGWELSYKDFDLQFRTDGRRVFLTDAYFNLDSITAVYEIEKKRLKRKEELDILIKYLSDAGKTVSNESDMPGYIKSSANDILFFADSLNLINWAIDDLIIIGVYPTEINLSSIVPSIVISEKASVYPPSGEKIDFSNEQIIIYTVTAEDGSVKTYRAQAVVK
jgi:hypothetical protein